MNGPLLVVNLTRKVSGASLGNASADFFLGSSFAASGALGGSGGLTSAVFGGSAGFAVSAGGGAALRSSAASLDGCELEQPEMMRTAQAAAVAKSRLVTGMFMQSILAWGLLPRKKGGEESGVSVQITR